MIVKYRHGASAPPSKYDLADILFPDENLDFCSISEIYYTSNNLASVGPVSSDYSQSNKHTFINTNFMADQEKYSARATSMSKKAINQPCQFLNTENITRYSVSEENQKKIGIKAEHFFSCYLKQQYGNSYDEYQNWVSSARNVVFPSMSADYDDSLGYDFMIQDFDSIFSPNTTTKTKTCFIEVKGTKESWDGTFHLSQNEKLCRDKIATNKENETYLIVIIENVYDSELIDIACIIDWSDKLERISLDADSYLATYNQGRSLNRPNRPQICNRLNKGYASSNSNTSHEISFNNGEHNANNREYNDNNYNRNSATNRGSNRNNPVNTITNNTFQYRNNDTNQMNRDNQATLNRPNRSQVYNRLNKGYASSNSNTSHEISFNNGEHNANNREYNDNNYNRNSATNRGSNRNNPINTINNNTFQYRNNNTNQMNRGNHATHNNCNSGQSTNREDKL